MKKIIFIITCLAQIHIAFSSYSEEIVQEQVEEQKTNLYYAKHAAINGAGLAIGIAMGVASNKLMDQIYLSADAPFKRLLVRGIISTGIFGLLIAILQKIPKEIQKKYETSLLLLTIGKAVTEMIYASRYQLKFGEVAKNLSAIDSFKLSFKPEYFCESLWQTLNMNVLLNLIIERYNERYKFIEEVRPEVRFNLEKFKKSINAHEQ